jgi:hypothetical protein
MKILSHRGYWKTACEKNQRAAFIRSFELGFGTETDVRDLGGKIVISHDMPSGEELSLEEFLNIFRAHAPTPLPLALNVKSDGLAEALKWHLLQAKIGSAFVFDMSVPDMRGYLRSGLPVYTRMSEVEQDPPWLDKAVGVWLDSFEGEWYAPKLVEDLLARGKEVCIVSPELHGRLHAEAWSRLTHLADCKGLSLCTDLPEEAASVFGI